MGDELGKCSWWKWMFDILTARNVLFCVQIYQRKAAQLTDINCETYTVIFSYSWTMLWSTCSIENLDWNGSVEFTLEALLKLLSVPKSLQGWLKTNKRLWKHCLVCYTKIPKNTGILFSKIPVSVFEFNPGIPVFSGIPQGPAGNLKPSVGTCYEFTASFKSRKDNMQTGCCIIGVVFIFWYQPGPPTFPVHYMFEVVEFYRRWSLVPMDVSNLTEPATDGWCPI